MVKRQFDIGISMRLSLSQVLDSPIFLYCFKSIQLGYFMIYELRPITIELDTVWNARLTSTYGSWCT